RQLERREFAQMIKSASEFPPFFVAPADTAVSKRSNHGVFGPGAPLIPGSLRKTAPFSVLLILRTAF
ncbi:MAG: hypothetical protein FWB91_12790, partial [Defluviitaleaceae bacterium]|nr:hypothetical protein [Defluviitaleaceae bacterium]